MNSANNIFFRIYYKNWKGEWTADNKKFATKSGAINKRLIAIRQKALNGLVTIQEFDNSCKTNKIK